MIENARPQVGDDPAERVDGAVDPLAHALALGGEVGAGVEPAAQPVDVELERDQQRAELVVDVAGDAGALVLAHGLEVGRELAHGAEGARELGGALVDPALEIGPRLAQLVFGEPALGDVDEG